jgi:adenylosuccinate synthase
VTPEGRHHTFAQFGAGSFVPGVRTFLSRFVVVHPTALLREAAVLESAGVPDPLARLALSEAARIVTPFHQAANRLRELARGEARHGSCGVGVGEAVHGALLDPDGAIRARDLLAPRVLTSKLERLRERLEAELRALPIPRTEDAEREWRFFDSRETIAAWCAAVRPVAQCLAPDERLADWLSEAPAVVFEGAQGLLLDENHGFHPHTTWSDCTAKQAHEVLAEAAPEAALEVWGVLRAHAVRHGAGPLPSETPELAGLIREHNTSNAWQGPVRYGWFDCELARHALERTPQLDVLLLTHVDALARRASWPVRDSVHGELPGDEAGFLAGLEARLGRRIDAVSRGPSARDVELLLHPAPGSLTRVDA